MGTPGCSSFCGSPSSTPFRPDVCIAQADYKAKNAAQCDLFIKCKRLTAANKAAIFQVIQDNELDIIEYDSKPQTFFCIMMQYVDGLGMVPEDVWHKQVKEMLFTFIMQNVSYTKVNVMNHQNNLKYLQTLNHCK